MNFKDLLRVPVDLMPLEQCAMLREILTAYRLLEDASLKVGGPVVGVQCGLQLGRAARQGAHRELRHTLWQTGEYWGV